MNKDRIITITLPKSLEDVKVKVERGNCTAVVLKFDETEQNDDVDDEHSPFSKRFVELWQGDWRLLRPIGDVLFIEAAGSYTTVHFLNGDKATISTTFNIVLEQLPKDDFMQIHRSYAVNIHHIKAREANLVYLSNGRSVPIGKQYKKLFNDSIWTIKTRRPK
ncbi:LytR/AlgR family response regulator transcription factor [Prevotella merdae]|uniref:LytR/AlgR family response regulator transcription factor n=1 Tax=Prevotella merdae TaxID=2079531 RepID=UPI003565C32D